KFNGTSWTPWATVPGTNTGTQTRNFITGTRTLTGTGQIGLAWTQGSDTFDVFSMAFNTTGAGGPSAVAATVIAPLNGSIVSGTTVAVSATASSTAGSGAGGQFLLP